MGTKKQLAIVHTDDQDGRAGYAMMDKSDFRYGEDEPWGYRHVANVVRREKAHTAGNGYRANMVHGDDGGTYEVFVGDWSAKKVA